MSFSRLEPLTNAAAEQFQPNWESLARYQCPEWFRDAKFGIWAHWSAQCVPEQGDWYARHLYEEGSDHYRYHCATYGHPSEVGFKDIERMWTAERWSPDALMQLYKAAGAKYFVALANHHDNLDCYDSAYQPWNSVNVGPKRDIVGTWAKVAREHGLHFGVSNHASHAWSWLEVAQGADKTGPYAGVPYDGVLTKADGEGKWWEGLDPQDLYSQSHKPGKGLVWEWSAAAGSSIPDQAYLDKFYNRTIDLIDKYQPDLIYFDDTVLPLYQVSDVGLRITAQLYNSSARRCGGKVEAVVNGKQLTPDQAKCIVQDLERGGSDKINPEPWQTDTCIGDWHYKRSLFENHQYKTAEQVVKMLVDIVAKNGNLLLSIPLRGDGTIDEDERRFLTGMAAWMIVNGEAIYGTRPWKISGEGPSRSRGGMFSEGSEKFLGAEDFRFTTKDGALYATAMGWPKSGSLVVRTLASAAAGIQGTVKNVSLLGSNEKLQWRSDETGLVVALPEQKPCEYAYVLKIEGIDLAASEPVPPPQALPEPIHASADGTITLAPEAATLQGGLRAQGGAVPNIGWWNNGGDSVSWRVHIDAPGSYDISTRTASAPGGSTFAIDTGAGGVVKMKAPQTKNWDDYVDLAGGPLKFDAAGDYTIVARPVDPVAWLPINLAAVVLKRR